MIATAELKRLAGESGIHYGAWERDYCLNWLLYGISRERALHRGVVLKGAAAIKKCYFADFRLSQELDFTCRKELRQKQLAPLLINACRNASYGSGLSFQVAEFQRLPKENGASFAARIEYRGPSNPREILPRIQVNLAYGGDLLHPAEERRILHFYGDPLRGARAWCHSLEEILAEKMVAILQQQDGRPPQPWDFYDLWWVLQEKKGKIDRRLTGRIFRQTCKLKGMEFESTDDFFNKEGLAKNKTAWEASVGRQAHAAPSFEQTIRELGPLVGAVS